MIVRKRKEIEAISAGDRIFFDRLCQENKKFLFYMAGKYAESQLEREDLVQETVMRLLNNISTLKALSQENIRSYIALTVKSVFIDSIKCKPIEKSIALDDIILQTLDSADYTERENMSEVFVQLEIEHLKQELSPRDWLVLEGRYLLGYSQEELASLIDVTPNSVRMILHRAREKAHEILSPNKKNDKTDHHRKKEG